MSSKGFRNSLGIMGSDPTQVRFTIFCREVLIRRHTNSGLIAGCLSAGPWLVCRPCLRQAPLCNACHLFGLHMRFKS